MLTTGQVTAFNRRNTISVTKYNDNTRYYTNTIEMGARVEKLILELKNSKKISESVDKILNYLTGKAKSILGTAIKTSSGRKKCLNEISAVYLALKIVKYDLGEIESA